MLLSGVGFGIASLTITGNGSFIAKSNDIYAIDVQDGSTCTIENGVYVAGCETRTDSNIACY